VALKLAFRRIGPVLGYAVIAGTIGVVLQALCRAARPTWTVDRSHVGACVDGSYLPRCSDPCR
jgi:hypothetical protein